MATSYGPVGGNIACYAALDSVQLWASGFVSRGSDNAIVQTNNDWTCTLTIVSPTGSVSTSSPSAWPTGSPGDPAFSWYTGIFPGPVVDEGMYTAQFQWEDGFGNIYYAPTQFVRWDSTNAVNLLPTTSSDAADAKTQATIAATQATLARKYLGNKIEPNSTTSPTQLTYYDDNNTTPIGTRSISNGNNSVPTATQVLRMGKIT